MHSRVQTVDTPADGDPLAGELGMSGKEVVLGRDQAMLGSTHGIASTIKQDTKDREVRHTVKPARLTVTVQGAEGGRRGGGESRLVGQEGEAVRLPEDTTVIQAVGQVLCHLGELDKVWGEPEDVVSPDGMCQWKETIFEVNSKALPGPLINNRSKDVVKQKVPEGRSL